MSNLAENNMVFAYAGNEASGITVNVSKNVTKIPSYLFDPYDSLARRAEIVAVLFEVGSECKSIGESAFAYSPIKYIVIKGFRC